MRNNEYNNVEITNEKQTRGLEFGKTQRAEFTSQKDNKLPNGELNEKYVGKTIRKQTEVNVQYVNKASAPTHASTTVHSAATASSTASAVTTVATAASVVAVTAVAVATGVSVALHDYDYKFNSFLVTDNSLTYELYVVDYKNDERADGQSYETYASAGVGEQVTEEKENEPFTLRVYNDYYDYSIPTYLDINEGTFTGLTPNQKYHITLSENRFGGETIFDEVFTTKEEDKRVSEFRGVTWDKKCNFLTNEMTIQLDYQDDFDRFSDFKFTLKSEMVTADGPSELVYDLQKTTEEQKIKLDSNQMFNLVQTYDYSFTYKDNEQNAVMIIDSGTVHFEDNSGAKSEFNKFIFEKTANFLNRTFEVQLDFVDDFNVYSDFVLSFYYIFDDGQQPPEEEQFSIDVPLVKTTEVQTVDLDGVEISLSETYDYKLFCNYYGEKTELDSGTVKFTDNSGAIVQFNELIFNKKVNFDTRTFEVQLDYQDDLGYLYGFQFILTDLETEEERTFYLLEQTEVQTITVNEVKETIDEKPVYFIDVVNHRMKYSFKYMNLDQEITVVDDEEFKFKNSLVSTFTGVETPYDFVEDAYDDYILPIRFIYNDAAHIYTRFDMELYKNNELYGRLMIENERSLDKWFYATFAGMEGHEIEDVLGGNVTLKVLTYVPSEESQDLEELEVYSDVVTLTKKETQAFYDVDFDDGDMPGTITGDQIGFTPIFTGDFGTFYDTFLVFECKSGHVYTLYFNPTMANQMVWETFRGCAEFEDQEEDFQTDFSEPVKITLYYDTTHEEYAGDNGSGPMYNVVPDGNLRTIVISESYLFTLSA